MNNKVLSIIVFLQIVAAILSISLALNVHQKLAEKTSHRAALDVIFESGAEPEEPTPSAEDKVECEQLFKEYREMLADWKIGKDEEDGYYLASPDSKIKIKYSFDFGHSSDENCGGENELWYVDDLSAPFSKHLNWKEETVIAQIIKEKIWFFIDNENAKEVEESKVNFEAYLKTETATE